MRCTKCRCYMPNDSTLGHTFPCIFCNGTQKVSTKDYLSEPQFGVVPGSRVVQLQVADLIENNIRNNGTLLIEAGTGVGKSYAYLLPSILTGKRALISTAKKSLQSQLENKDLPALQRALSATGNPFSYVVIYGKSNYACQYAVKKKVSLPVWKKTWQPFFTKNPDGMWTDPEAPKWQPGLTAEDCKGASCTYASSCGYIAKRQLALKTDVVVTNHWLTGYHIRSVQTDLSPFPLLGAIDTLIVDEAHKFEEGVRSAYSADLKESAFYKTLDDYEEVLGFAVADDAVIRSHVQTLFAQLHPTQDSSCELGSAGKRLEAALRKAHSRMASKKVYSGELASTVHQYDKVTTLFDTWAVALNRADTSDNYIAYLSGSNMYRSIRVSPVSVASMINAFTFNPERSCTYLSATLAIAGNVDHFKRRLGAEPTDASAIFGTAFNYGKQALLYLSPHVPVATRADDKVEEYRSLLAKEIHTLLEAHNGHAFVLFTARDEMNDVYERLCDRYEFPVIKQETNAVQTLEKFKRKPGSVLFGLKSFWEGVDIPGDALGMVIITKLPFPGRGDPILNARRAYAGNKWFNSVDFPEMVLDLRQGIGRLIRTEKDRGVIAILDKRLLSKGYRHRAIKALGIPAAKITQSRERTVTALQTLRTLRERNAK